MYTLIVPALRDHAQRFCIEGDVGKPQAADLSAATRTPSSFF